MDGTVLVADDDRTIRTVLTQALTRAGCKVHATSSLMTLMRWVEEGKGDLVISDVIMPDGNGLLTVATEAQAIERSGADGAAVACDGISSAVVDTSSERVMRECRMGSSRSVDAGPTAFLPPGWCQSGPSGANSSIPTKTAKP